MSNLFEKLGIDIGIIVLILLILVVFLLFMAVVQIVRLHRLNLKYKVFMKGSSGRSLQKEFEHRFKQLEEMEEKLGNHQLDINAIKAIQNKTLHKYGIVTYDAFDDMGGKLSFALAMLDKDNTGFILNAIHSRENCFLYIKEILNGESFIILSKEEIEALRRAVNSESDEIM